MKLVYLCALLTSCVYSQSQGMYPDIEDTARNTFCVSSNDTMLVKIFNWAVGNSNKYVGDDSDPVGPWYEAALPDREAFCMRDVSHQCIGEELNGHSRQNLNMLTRFVENISVSKDYCSYWEINKDNLPAPADYVSDKDFWYNLNANFDVLNACYRLYLWTGDETYINDPRFETFFRLTANEYINHWQLQADKIMQRPGVMHEDDTLVDPKFKTFRGLPSYEESVRGLTVTGDLIASVYKGLKSYAQIWKVRGNEDSCRLYENKASEYARLYNSVWWNEQTQNYYAYKLEDEILQEGGNNVFPLWFEIINNSGRVDRLLEMMAEKETNVESMSYYPMIFYKYGKKDIAYHYLNELYSNKRRDYPEVASGVIEGIVCGIAGVNADAVANRISTLPRFTSSTGWLSVENIPVFSGKISILHHSGEKSSLVNKLDKEFVWRAMFPGKVKKINEKTAEYVTDALGNNFSFIDLICRPGETVTAEVQYK
ncbi:trehalase family glycosidase [Parabacteroides timonensis]|uniref:trehalase family glycosidase n=1 Tax=Parabacteroides timonensis TaxID=1871013 RepID=UPI00094E8391|nr:trehalase family glycosidase [Parabacteroides timonensis]